MDHGSFEERLHPTASSVAAARSGVRGLLASAGREDITETAALLVSEVVTNALLHAGTDIDVRAVLDDDGLLVEVGDGSPNMPSRRRYSPTSGTGRGLLMLDSLVDDWGATPRGDGKVVWFRLSDSAGGPSAQPAAPLTAQGTEPGERRTASETIPVELRDMPLLLHAAWQEHAEALLREYLLASLDEDGPGTIKMHADATDAIAVLDEHVPRADVAMEPDELMQEAVEPHVSAPNVEVPVPASSVAHFDTLDRAVQRALDLSREGLVLTPPTPPEVQAFREWIVGQVLGQAAGAAPDPWRVPAVDVDEAELPGVWDPSSVTESDRGLIAADETSRILAVSRVAAELLGYDEPEELRGRRVVSIMPERYRQAHVAGFTMYLLVGRGPLLDRPVTVPALRKDGTEVPVELTVHPPERYPGLTVFVADFRGTTG